MQRIVLIESTACQIEAVASSLRQAGNEVIAASSAYALLTKQPADVTITKIERRNGDLLSNLGTLLGGHRTVPLVIIVSVAENHETKRRVAVPESPARRSIDDRGALSNDALLKYDRRERGDDIAVSSWQPESHATVRWARAVVPLIDSPQDPRTISHWGRWIAASPGAIRNWCSTAGITARTSLTFGRLLRAVIRRGNGRHKLEDLLDVVDRRTLVGLVRRAGLEFRSSFPQDHEAFLVHQTLIDDHNAVDQVRRVLNEWFRIDK